MSASLSADFVTKILALVPGSRRDVFDMYIRGTPFEFDPFTNVLLDSDTGPGARPEAFPAWTYLLPLFILGPLTYNMYALFMSLVSGEWWKHKTFRREAIMAARSIAVTSPLLVVVFSALFEQRWGRLYYSKSETAAQLPWYYPYLLQPLLHVLISDTTFYWTHRSWHTPWLYANSHYHHHSCRPTTSFAGNAADAFEVSLTGYVTALMPAFIIPCEASMFMALSLFGHAWSIYLHNFECHVMPGWLYDSFDHNVHHHYGERNYNYGLYFEFWDRAMGTYRDRVPTSKRIEQHKYPIPLLPPNRAADPNPTFAKKAK
eukprot:UC1_evm3s2028